MEKMDNLLERLQNAGNAILKYVPNDKSDYWEMQNAVNVAIANIRMNGKTARWEKITGIAPPEYHGRHVCSNCDCFAPVEAPYGNREILSAFCPGCGARMEDGKDAGRDVEAR